MLRISIYAILIVILTMAAASAQTDKPGLPGYTNSIRTDLEKKNDREIDRAYRSTIQGRPDAEKRTLIRGPPVSPTNGGKEQAKMNARLPLPAAVIRHLLSHRQ
jgi:hypothetical protein